MKEESFDPLDMHQGIYVETPKDITDLLQPLPKSVEFDDGTGENEFFEHLKKV